MTQAQNKQNPQREEYNFVYDDDLLLVFKKLGIEESFLQGKLNCNFCDEVVSMDNLSSLYLEDKKIKLVCSNESCINLIYKGDGQHIF